MLLFSQSDFRPAFASQDKMISDLLVYLTPAYVLGSALVLGFLAQVYVRINYQIKFKRQGGVHLPKLANNPISGI
jgi:hypothetical protein